MPEDDISKRIELFDNAHRLEEKMKLEITLYFQRLKMVLQRQNCVYKPEELTEIQNKNYFKLDEHEKTAAEITDNIMNYAADKSDLMWAEEHPNHKPDEDGFRFIKAIPKKDRV